MRFVFRIIPKGYVQCRCGECLPGQFNHAGQVTAYTFIVGESLDFGEMIGTRKATAKPVMCTSGIGTKDAARIAGQLKVVRTRWAGSSLNYVPALAVY
jgi:hypothetical protein